MSSPQQADLELQRFFKVQANADKEYLREDKRDVLNRKRYFKACEAAEKITEANVNKPAIRLEMRGTRELKTFHISTEATAAQLEELYRLRHERYIEICSLLIAIWKDDGTADGTWDEIPVTPKNNVNNPTFHSIVISCPGMGFLEILIRESDNYIVAFRVYRTPAEKGTKKWCTFKENLPGHFKTHKTNYGSGHTYIAHAKIGFGVLEEVFNFLSQLQENRDQETTDDGYKCLGTLYVLFGEAQRFKRIRAWVVSVMRDMLVKDCSSLFSVRGTFELFVRDWSSLSKAGFGIIRALLESPLSQAYRAVHCRTPGYDDSDNPYNTLDEAAQKLEEKQSKHQDAGLRLRFSGNSKFKLGPAAENSVIYQFTDKFVLHSLVGEELSLLNHSDKECKHLLMRQAGYRGILYGAN